MTHPSIAQRCAALGVERRTVFWADLYKGTADALIAAGVITASQPLPGTPGFGKVQVSFYDGERLRKGASPPDTDERYLRVNRVSRHQYLVCRGLDGVERERRLAERKREAGRVAEKARAASAALGADPEQFRAVMGIAAQSLSHMLRTHTPGDHHQGTPYSPCCFDPEGFDDVLEALEEIQEWIRTAQVRERSVVGHKFSVARMDAAFQAFLQSQCLGGA